MAKIWLFLSQVKDIVIINLTGSVFSKGVSTYNTNTNCEKNGQGMSEVTHRI